jgi:hypothetical protein
LIYIGPPKHPAPIANIEKTDQVDRKNSHHSQHSHHSHHSHSAEKQEKQENKGEGHEQGAANTKRDPKKPGTEPEPVGSDDKQDATPGKEDDVMN